MRKWLYCVFLFTNFYFVFTATCKVQRFNTDAQSNLSEKCIRCKICIFVTDSISNMGEDSHEGKIAELRKVFEDEKGPEKLAKTDYFYRFLRARNFDLHKAEKLLRETIRWRKESNIENFLKDYEVPEVLQKYYSTTRLGTTKDGNLLYLARAGKNDMKGIAQSITSEEWVKFIISIMEESLEIMSKSCSKGLTVVFDFEGVTFGQATYWNAIKMYVEGLQMIEKYYPEMYRKIFVLNVSRLFTLGFSMVKHLIPVDTFAKIHFYSYNDDWKSALLEDIDADVLPVHWGGTRIDETGEPDCPELISRGGTIPIKYYKK